MEVYIRERENVDVENQEFELVERKGVGHPDTMCDAIAETASRKYCQYCINVFGKPAHHWFDKVMLIGGQADVNYGKGIMIEPYTIIFAGKVTNCVGDTRIPVEKLLYQSAAEVLSTVLTGFDPRKHMKIVNYLVDYQGAGRKNDRYRPQSICELPELNSQDLVSNDCNLLSAYAPLTVLEAMTLFAERYINGETFKRENPDTGWDVKVFGHRENNKFSLLINMPFLAKDIISLEQYFKRKNEVYNDIKQKIERKFKQEVNLMMNATDRNGRPYLTALGSVADTGDVGVVGRGNRINGLITPMRPMSIEAPAGKNPIDHTGKIYSVVVNELAHEIYNSVRVPVSVHIFTSKERSLSDPDQIIVQLSKTEKKDIDYNKIIELIKNKMNHVSYTSRQIIIDGVEMW